MARIVNSTDVPALLRSHELSDEGKLWIYNLYDCTTTHEGFDELEAHDDDISRQTYAFSMVQQAPALAMMRRGCRIDMIERERLAYALKRKMDSIFQKDGSGKLNYLSRAWWDLPLNPLSPKQLNQFFYESMGLPVQLKRDKFSGEKKPTCDDEALERLARDYFIAEPFVKLILRYKELQGKYKILKSAVDPDGRMRCSFNVGATETGRWSSSKNAFGGGTNGQNITPEMRSIFISDPDWVLGYADLQQAESRGVGYLSGDEAYIRACESGDLHTSVCQEMWPDLSWTGDIWVDKKMCDSKMFDALHSYRWMAKSNGHATNYYATPYTLAARSKMAVRAMEIFQEAYFGRFPLIAKWHEYIASELQTKQCLITPLWRRRHFFGRLNDDHTLREAIAHVPQSLIADILNIGLLRVFRYLEGRIQLLFQIHDAILFQFRRDDLEVLDEVRDLMTFAVRVHDRLMTIPVEIKVGYDWANLVLPQELPNIKPRSMEILDRAIV